MSFRSEHTNAEQQVMQTIIIIIELYLFEEFAISLINHITNRKTTPTQATPLSLPNESIQLLSWRCVLSHETLR